MSDESQSLGDRVLRSATFILIANGIQQSIGIVSMLILARLLTPQDYGIVAAAMLVIHFFDVLSSTGIDDYVLSRKTLEEEELHTAWTIRLAVKVMLASTVVLLAPWFAAFFEQPELKMVLLVAAAIPIIEGLQSPGLLLLRRNFQYRTISLMMVGSKLTAFVAGLSVAIVFRSYWALIVSTLVFVSFTTVFSYRLYAIKPRLTLSYFGSQWHFSKWSVVRALMGFSRSKADNFFVGKFLGVTELGVYSLSKTLATMPHDHLTHALTGLFTSSIGGSRDRVDNAASSLSKIMATVVSIMLPVAVGMFLVAEPMVSVLLGPNWSNAVPIIQALSLLSITYALFTAITTSIVALGHIKTASILDGVSLLIVLAVMLLTLSFSRDTVLIAAARSFSAVSMLLMFYFFICRIINMPHWDLVRSFIPAVVGSTIMTIVVNVCNQLTDLNPLSTLLLMIGAGGIVYTVVFVSLLWRLRKLTPELEFIYYLLLRMISYGRNRVGPWLRTQEQR